MAHRQGYGQNFTQNQQANQRLWSGAVSPNSQGGIASSLLGAVPGVAGGTNMERLAVIAKVLGNTMQANQLQNIGNMNFQAANSALQMQRSMAQQQGGLAGMASVPNALGAGLLGNGPAGLQSASVLTNFQQQQQRQLLLQQQQTSLLGTPPQIYQNVQSQGRRNIKRNNVQRSRRPSSGDKGRGSTDRGWSRDRRSPDLDQHSEDGRRDEDDNGPDVKKARVDTAVYDPSEPTPDDDEDRNVEQVPASDIQVTIQQGREGHTVNDDRPGQQGTDTQKIYMCYACNAKCYNHRNYEAHMTGNRHKQRMLKIQEFTQMRVQQATAHMQARMKAEQHLRKIEGQGLGRHSASKSNQRKPSTKLEKHWCETCKINYYGPIVEHRRTKDHKTSKKSSRPACHLCKVQFKSPKKMVAHCNTEEHKAKFREAQDRKKTGHDEEWFPDNPEEMVTVDAVGCFDSDEEDMGENKEAGEEELKESNGAKADVEDGEEDISGDIPPQDVVLRPIADEEFSLADLPSQDTDLRQMMGPPLINLPDNCQAPAKMQDELQDIISGATSAFPTELSKPEEEESTPVEEVQTDVTVTGPHDMGNLHLVENQTGEKSLSAEMSPATEQHRLQESEFVESKELVSAQIAESATSAQSEETTQAQDMEDTTHVLPEETSQVHGTDDTSLLQLGENTQAQDTEDTPQLQSEETQQAQDTVDTTALQTEETPQAPAEDVTVAQTEPTTDAHKQTRADRADEGAIEETEVDTFENAPEEFILPPYDPDCAVGQEFVIPVSGYFCKLCHKFYKNEESAVVNHCRSQLHYNKVKAELEKSSCAGPPAASDDTASSSIKQRRDHQPSDLLSASGKEEVSSGAGVWPMETGRETSHGKKEQTLGIGGSTMEPTSSTATESPSKGPPASNVQAYNISSFMEGPGFQVMEVQDNSPSEATMNIRIVNSFTLDSEADEKFAAFSHGEEVDEDLRCGDDTGLMEMMDVASAGDMEDCDDESSGQNMNRPGTPKLMSEIEEYLTGSGGEETSERAAEEVPGLEETETANQEDAEIDKTVESLVKNQSDSSKQGPISLTPIQDSAEPPETPSPRRGARKTARKPTRGGKRK